MTSRRIPLEGLPADARPREKLLARGPAALSDAELLALLLRTGVQGKNVLQLADELVHDFGGVRGLLHSGADALKQVKGLGPAKRAELLAVVELARRALAQELKEKPLFDSPQAVAHYLQLHFGHKPHEVFAVLFLDSQHRPACGGILLCQTTPHPYMLSSLTWKKKCDARHREISFTDRRDTTRKN